MKIALYSLNPSIEKSEQYRLLIERIGFFGAQTISVQNAEELSDADLLLSIGGDGTFLRVVNMLRGSQIPVAGINFGHLGFLTTAKVTDGDNSWIADLVNKNYTVEKRDLLQVESSQLPTGIYPCCLNEFSIQRNKPSMLRISIAIDGTQLPSYWADGVVVASPTGSTAYSMSVGGPIVLPSSKVAVIAPIAPHNLNIRPLVVPLDSLIELKFEGAGSDAVVTMDNRDYLVPSGTVFKVRKAAKPVQCVLLNNMNFIEALQDKLLWGEDRRNLI